MELTELTIQQLYRMPPQDRAGYLGELARASLELNMRRHLADEQAAGERRDEPESGR
jgi:hypothetical protein